MARFIGQLNAYLLNFYAAYKNHVFFTHRGTRVVSNTPAFKEHELIKRGEKLKAAYKNSFEKLRKDVYLIEYPHAMCFSVGYNFRISQKSDAAIFMSKGLFDLDEEAFSFLLKHEISDIRHSDVLMRSCVSTLGAALVAAAISLVFSPSFAFLSFLGAIPFVDPFLGGLWMRLRESRADDYAMHSCRTEEIQGAVRYFSAVKAYNASLASLHPQYTEEGELASGLHYPTNASRIAKFLKEIQKRTGEDYHPDPEDIERHVVLLKRNDEALKAILAGKDPESVEEKSGAC